ncbi:hypothetical protein ACUN0C_15410 [Faunimonas sp. B44]|uniref:hypothetical protein n=1 Tax=Faunimonas sp. B44 TaxID=3461493 RepID=UPI004044A09C
MPNQPQFPRLFSNRHLGYDGDAPQSGPAPAEGDSRGRYGYGRPAHGSDPRATYTFGRRS